MQVRLLVNKPLLLEG